MIRFSILKFFRKTKEPKVDIKLVRVLELRNKATPWPWIITDSCVSPATDKFPALHKVKIRPMQDGALGTLQLADAELIVAMREFFESIEIPNEHNNG